ncbi:MAG: hypothetical protein LBD69_04540 [Puniceicoccales bacterium]|jgi:hypothetical protein|nr:hypothetical protein [Puniceicoccales bacterium]
MKNGLLIFSNVKKFTFFGLCLGLGLAVAQPVSISENAMALIQDESYQNMLGTLTSEHEGEIYAIFKDIVPASEYCIAKDSPDYQEAGECCLQERLDADERIGPEYYIVHLIRENNWSLRQNPPAESTEKSYYDDGYRTLEVYDLRGEDNVYWALYQAGWRFMETNPNLSLFCFKHLLILSNGQFPCLVWKGGDERAIVRLKVALRKVASSFYNQSWCTDDLFEKTSLMSKYQTLCYETDRALRY